MHINKQVVVNWLDMVLTHYHRLHLRNITDSAIRLLQNDITRIILIQTTHTRRHHQSTQNSSHNIKQTFRRKHAIRKCITQILVHVPLPSQLY